MSTAASVTPAEVFPLSEYLRDELEANGWTATEFAQIIGRPLQVVSEILNDRKLVTEETAQEIAAATGTEAATWLGLQSAYKLWKLSQQESSTDRISAVARRARLTRIVPLAELRKRKLVHDTDLDAQESDVKRLLGISSLSSAPLWSVAARRSGADQDLTSLQWTWVACVRAAAAAMSVSTYQPGLLRDIAQTLTTTVLAVEDVKQLPQRFAAAGVKLVYVPPFKSAKMDGAAMTEDGVPVIGISGRLQGLDSFLYTLLHECAHVLCDHIADTFTLDNDLQHSLSERREREANSIAAGWVLSSPLAVGNRISRGTIVSEAQRLGVHPSVIVGQLRHQGKVPFTDFHALVPKVRSSLEAWGTSVS